MTTRAYRDKLNYHYQRRDKRGLVMPEFCDILNSEVPYMSIGELQDFVVEFGYSPSMGEDDLRALVDAIINGEPEEPEFPVYEVWRTGA
jgi:hypothetical protein